MIKKITLLLALVAISSGYAQEGTASPYSFFGTGLPKFKGTVENKSLGGISVYADSIHLNLQNPASLAKLKLTTFTAGVNQNFASIATDESKGKTSTTSLDYLALGLPMGKMSMSFGLAPSTAVGYKIGFDDYASAEEGDVRYQGKGGLNKVFLAGAYNITTDLALGLDLSYTFGSIYNEVVSISGVQYDTQEVNDNRLSGLTYKFGAYYQKDINKDLYLASSLTFAPSTRLNSRLDRVTSSVTWTNNGYPQIIQASDEAVTYRTNYKLPSEISAGFGFGKASKWFAGMDYTTSDLSGVTNRFYNIDNVSFHKATKLSLGGFILPKYNSLVSYLDRVVYRVGARFENTGLVINDEKIKEFGISFGLGLPVGRTFSNMNFGMEYGSRGTKTSGLVKEDFFNFNLSFSFNDKWFQRRKID